MKLVADQPRRLYSTSELAEAVGVPAQRVSLWVGAKLLHPSAPDDDGAFFDFAQVSAAKTLQELSDSGLSERQIHRHLAKLRAWHADDAASPAGAEGRRRLLIRLADGDLAETDGQLRFDFSRDSAPMQLPLGRSEVTAAQWRELSHEQEADGNLGEAVKSYRTALAVGGFDATISFELAHALAETGEVEAAAERYRQVVEAEPAWGDAWNNLGILLGETGKRDESAAAFERALAINPDDARAHYNLADALDELGRSADAKPHWQAYLRFDGHSQWARHARSRVG